MKEVRKYFFVVAASIAFGQIIFHGTIAQRAAVLFLLGVAGVLDILLRMKREPSHFTDKRR